MAGTDRETKTPDFDEKNAPRRRVVPPVYLLLSLIAMVTLHTVVPAVQTVQSALNYAGIALFILGVVITVSAAGLFKKLGTPLLPFEESTVVVTTGMFRWTRNPMYLGMTVGLFGVALFLGSLVAFLPIPIFVAIIRFRFIDGEEQFMEDLFGEEYLAYKRRVRRWF